MKNTISRVASVLVVVAASGVFAPNANALSWTISPDANALAFGVSVVDGLAEIGSPDIPGQPTGIFGAGFTQFGSSFSMDFDADLYSWDAYQYGRRHWYGLVGCLRCDRQYRRILLGSIYVRSGHS